MNSGPGLLIISMLLVGCASTPKAPVKKKPGVAAAAPKTVKGGMPVKGAAKTKAPVPPQPTAPAAEPETEEVEDEEDDQFSRIKKYYKK